MESDKIRCVIVEDELPAIAVLKLHLAHYKNIELMGTFRSVSKAFEFLHLQKIDLIFLDIHLPELSGLELARSLPPPCQIIFTTADKKFALEGFDLGAVDYLLKPISFERFAKAMSRFLHISQIQDANIETLNRPFIFVKCERRMTKIFLDEILYVEAQRNYLSIVTNHDTHRTYLTTAEMEEKLPEKLFLRVHRSFIVSINKIENFSHHHVVLSGKEIPVGRNYQEVYKRLKDATG